MAIPAFSLILGKKTVGGSPIGSPELTKTMLDFCVRHNIYPTVEEFPMEKVKKADSIESAFFYHFLKGRLLSDEL